MNYEPDNNCVITNENLQNSIWQTAAIFKIVKTVYLVEKSIRF